nr:MMPL family transporter [Neisseria musculi]
MLAAGGRLQTDLTALLPHAQQPDALLRAADKAVQAQADTRVVLLAGSSDAEKAFQTAAEIAGQWRSSGVFAAVESHIEPDLAALRADMQRLGAAALPRPQRRLLFEEPQRYFQERAESLLNPFAAPTLLPPEQDWLGFSRFAQEQAQTQSRLQWHSGNGMLFTEEDGKTWVWLSGRLPEGNTAGSAGLLALMQQSRRTAEAAGVETLSTGGALFAAAAKEAAERESQLMGSAGLLLTFGLLLRVFRTARVFWLLLPLAAGLAAGLAAVLAVFGEIHMLTIVVGTSLVGVLVDFPLHWLAGSVFGAAGRSGFSDGRVWQAHPAMRRVLPAFTVSLLITAAGYALLWFTPLPVLRQTAVFSGFALLGAFAATVLWLPPLFARYRPRSVPFAGLVEQVGAYSRRIGGRLKRRGWRLAGGLLLAAGLWRSDWHDDIRQWIDIPPEMLAQAQQIGRLAGADFSGSYLVAEAGSEDGLLQKNAEIRRALQPLLRQQKISGIQSLEQWLPPAAEQQKLKNRLRELAELPDTWQPLQAAGVPRQAVRRALNQAAGMPAATLSDGLKPATAEAGRQLYLGEAAPGRFASIVRLHGLNDAQAVQTALQGLEGAHWVDRRGSLNRLFAQTRNQALWLKLASYSLAALLLWRILGLRRGLRVLAVPLASAAATVAVLGWLGVPVGLFAVFGLLLVSAVGTDYAVYAAAAAHSPPARLGGLLLAALTTGISFTLLGMSGTPAVAAFGLTVAVGTAFNLWLAGRLSDSSEVM